MSTEINVTNEIIDINVTTSVIDVNVTNEIIVVEAVNGAYPLPSTVYSVFGRTGSIVAENGDYTTTLVTEGTNLYFTTQRVWDALSTIAPLSIASGVISISQSGASSNGYLSSIDWNIFNNKQNALGYTPVPETRTLTINGTTYDLSANRSWVINSMVYPSAGIPISTGTAWGTSITNNSSNWNTAYNRSLISASVTGTTTKTLTLNQQNGGTITASWTDINTDAVTSVFGRTGAITAQNGDYNTSLVTENTNLYFTNARSRNAISLTTTGISGAATYDNATGILNIPQYQGGVNSFNTRTGAITLLSSDVTTALGYTPVTEARTLTINGTTYDLSANRSWTISAGTGTVTSVGLSAPTGFSVSSSPITTSGTLALDFASGYSLPTNASQTNWDTAYTNRITSATSPLSITSNVISISQATTSTNGYLSSTDWNTFNGKGNGTVTSVGITTTASALSITSSPVVSSGNIGVNFSGSSTQYVAGDGTLVTFPTIITEAQNLICDVYNETGATLTKGTVVYINGGHGNLPTVTKALATSDATSAQTFGIVQANITNMNNGHVVVIGNLTDLDTQAYAEGTQLYLSSTTAGAYTSVKQYAPAHLVYVAIVVRSHPTQGIIQVKIQNGFEMDELHNVSAQTPSNGNILQYVSSTSLWTSVAGTTTNIAEGTNLYYTDTRSRAALSFTAGSGAYNSTTGVITIPTNNTQITNGSNYITLASLSAGTGISYNNTTGVITSSITQYTDALARAAISLTTTGSSGSSTYSSSTGVLNVPTYTLSGLGGQPLATNLTSLSGLSYASTSFVKMTASGTFSLDTNTYYLASNPSGFTSNTGTVTSVGLSSATSGVTIGSSPVTTSGTITISIATATSLQNGLLSSTDWSTFNGKANALSGTINTIAYWDSTTTIASLALATYPSLTELSYVKGVTSSIQTQIDSKQGTITLTTTGTSGAATLVGNTLNIPQYAGGSGSGITTLNTLTASTQTFAVGTSGTDFAISSATSTHTFNLPNASATARGVVTTGTQTFAGAKTFSSTSDTTFNGNITIDKASGNSNFQMALASVFKFAFGYNAGGNSFRLYNYTTAADAFNVSNSNSYFGILTNTIGSALQVNGNAAIGYSASTAAPTNGLQVAGTLSMNPTGAGTITLGSTSLYGVIGAVGTNAPAIYLNGGTRGGATPTSASGVVVVALSADFFITGTDGAATSSKFQVTSGGNIGVGNPTAIGSKLQINGNAAIGYSASTAAPTNGLSVAGTVYIGGQIGTQTEPLQIKSTNNAIIDVQSTATTNYSGMNMYDSTGALGASFALGNSAATGFINAMLLGPRLATGILNFVRGTAATISATIDASGNFGINTTTIGSTLQVNGSAAIGYSASTAAPANGMSVAGTVNIGTNTSVTTAALQVSSTTQGFLPPVMTTTQKNAITSPATGLVVFDSTLGKLCVFSTTWQTITSV